MEHSSQIVSITLDLIVVFVLVEATNLGVEIFNVFNKK